MNREVIRSKFWNPFSVNMTDIKSEEEKIDFMFRVIQYVERQIVLYDSVEDAAFTKLLKLDNYLSLKDFIHLHENKITWGYHQRKVILFQYKNCIYSTPDTILPPFGTGYH